MKDYFYTHKILKTLRFRMNEQELTAVDILTEKKCPTQAQNLPKSLTNLFPMLDRYFGGKCKCPKLPFKEQEGTEFQRAVWEEITKIPFGQTKTYSEIANAINRPKAVRAVGTACGANKLAILVPCHRVVSKASTLSGYKWGVQIKEKLLELESGRC